MKRKLYMALLYGACILILAASCGPGGEQGKTQSSAGAASGASSGTKPSSGVKSAAVCLPVTENDSLNPYTAKSKNNQELGLLLYDTLISLDENYELRYQLAESVQKNGKSYTIRLKSAVFSDGSAVTAEDVTYSLGAAQKSAGKYAGQLQNVASKSAAGTSVLTVTLKKDDPLFERLLDFPIFKRNSENVKDQDKKLLPPVGGGRYIYEKKENEIRLRANPGFRGGAPGTQTILLASTPDSVSLDHQVTSGAISLFYSDLSDGKFPVMNGAAARVPLNHLIYLGVNGKSGPLVSNDLRRAVNAALDRGGIAEKAYQTYALPASGVFHPLWKPGVPVENSLAAAPDLNLAVEELEKAGYNKKDSDGFYILSGKRLSLRLLYNQENAQRAAAAKQIQDSLKKAGIEVKLTKLAFAAYSQAVTAGNYDLYLGEMRFLNNMDVSPLMLEGATQSFFPENSPSAEALRAYLAGTGELSAFADALNAELPLIPLCYRSGILTSLPVFSAAPVPGASDIFSGLEALKLK